MLQQKRDDFLLRRLVKAGERLVEHDHLAGEGHSAHERHATSHAAGKLHRGLIQAIRRQNLGQQLAHVGAAGGRRQHQRHVLHRRQRFAEPVFLEHHAYLTRLDAANFTGIGRFEPQQHAEQRRLARAGRRHQTAHFPTGQRERHAPQHLVGAIRAANMIEFHIGQRRRIHLCASALGPFLRELSFAPTDRFRFGRRIRCCKPIS